MTDFRLEMSEDSQRLVQRFRRLPPAVRDGVRRGMGRALLVVEGRVRQGAVVRFRRGMAGLAGRLTSYARQAGDMGIDAAIGFRRTAGFPYELAQEFGARARRGKFMTVPISPLARAMSDRGQSARDMPELFRMRGTNVLATRPGPRSQPIVHYVLVRSIPPRLNFRATVRSHRDLISRGIMSGARESQRQTGRLI